MIASTRKELEYGFQDMKGILYLKVIKAKHNTLKLQGESDLAS